MEKLTSNDLTKLKKYSIWQFIITAIFASIIICVVIFTPKSFKYGVIILVNLAYIAFIVIFAMKICQFYIISKLNNKKNWIILYLFAIVICFFILMSAKNIFLYSINDYKMISYLYFILLLISIFFVSKSYIYLMQILKNLCSIDKFYFIMALICYILICIPDGIILLSHFINIQYQSGIMHDFIVIYGFLFYFLQFIIFIYILVLLFVNILFEFLAYNELIKSQIKG